MGCIPSSRLLGWHERLEAAHSAAEVVEACHDFVGRFAPAMLAQLPRCCLPPRELDGPTISAYAVELVRNELEAGVNASPVLSIFALFFTDASAAVARIALARRRPDLWPQAARRA